jgi:3-isopropylmalate/(R)-2-methylmalate dehydratase small subunit
MQKFKTLTAVAAPLPMINVDTDMIIPKQFLKTIQRTGLGKHLFDEMRYTTDGKEVSDFVLNKPAYRKSDILVAGPNFGCGSSREHAVWALRDYGFKAVFSSKFADIFRGNSGKQGLITGIIDDATIEKIWQALEANPGLKATVNLVDKTVQVGDIQAPFEIDEYTRWRLLEGLDDIGLTLRDEQSITDFEAKRPAWLPKTIPAKGA